ncbi:MAG: four helix bundle protein [Flavisolibacter sp.]
MFLQLNHQRLDIYKVAKEFVLESYKITRLFPSDERFSLAQQIRRAAISVHLNIAEGCSRKSIAERKRYFEISRGSMIEMDAAFDIASALGHCSKQDMGQLEAYTIRCFSMICKMMNKTI